MNLAELVRPDAPIVLRPVAERSAAIIELRVILVGMLREIRAEVVSSVLPEYREYRRSVNDALVIDRETPPSTWFDRLRAVAAAVILSAVSRVGRLLDREAATFTTRFLKSIKAGTKIDLPRSAVAPPDKMDDMLRIVAARNAARITSLSSEAVSRIEEVVLKSRLNRESARRLSKKLQDEFGVLKSRADFLAVDSIGSFHSSVTRFQHESIGISWYGWHDQGDGAVRSSHRALRGVIARWDEPGPGPRGTHPGEDYRCRCRASAVVVPPGEKPPARFDFPERTVFPKRLNTV